jgi:hypothetical protein
MNHAERPLFVEGRRHSCDHYHCHCTRPKLQIHWFGADDLAQTHKYRRNKQCDLGRASERDADAHIQVVLARSRNATAVSAAAPSKATTASTKKGGERNDCYDCQHKQ